MKLKTMCDEFLQKVLVERSNAVNEAVAREIQNKHEPYKAQMISTRDRAIANEEQQFKTLVEQITKEHNAKVEDLKNDFGKAIQTHRDEIARSAEATARETFDKFILGVSAVADDIKSN